MDSKRAELEDINDSMKKAMLTNRLEIWGNIHGDEANRFKTMNVTQKTESEKRVATQIARIKASTGRM